jgi:aminopeptidase N
MQLCIDISQDIHIICQGGYMTFFLMFLLNQAFLNIDNKQVLYPEPIMAESTHSYNVLHYLIDIELPMDSRYLEGAVTISARSDEDNLTIIDIHLLDLNVDSAKVDGVTATYNHVYETLYVNLPQPYNQGDSFDIMVGYSGTVSGSMGYYFYQYPIPISYTLGCPFRTRKWMPCYDRLWDKADYGVECYITVPDTFTVCATGAFLGKQVSQGKATYHWKHDRPIAPYLIHFASSIFTTYSDWFYPAPAESVEIKYYFWIADTIFAPTAFALTTDMIYFYDSLYGDYPFERYGMDILYNFYYAGMEHQTMSSIYRTGFTNYDYYLMAHEMSHQWWGDMVTCFGWANVWLNEGFATYSDALYLERREGHQAFLNTMVSRRNDYFQAEASTPRPIYDPPTNLIFAWGHTYCKGSWLSHMIRFLCGDDVTWMNFLAAYRSAFEYKNASSDDLNQIMNQVLGSNYDWFFNEWVYDMGYPIYDVVWGKMYESPNWRLILDITQTQTLGPSVFHMPLPVGVNYSSSDTILNLAINQSPQHFEFLLPQEPISITVDPETWIIQKNTVTGVQEIIVNKLSIEKVKTIGRAIEIKLNTQSLIKIYDITGRLVHETNAEELRYQPSSAGIYHIIVGDKNKRVVIVK